MAPSDSEQQHIVIVGGGMTGGLAALLLADLGVAVTVLDGAPEPVMPTGEPALRVSALSEASHWLLRNSGAWHYLDPRRVQPYESMHVWDQDGTGDVSFQAQDAGSDCLGWLMENNHVTAALYRAAADRANLDWRCNVRVNRVRRRAGQWHVNTDQGDWQADLLVGADGARSMVRDSGGISGAPRDSGHHALVAVIETEQPHGGCARQVFMESGPLAILPLFGEGHQSSIVWSGWPEVVESLQALDEETFAVRLTAASGEVLGALKPASRRLAFPIQERHAGSYVAEGLALVGDAAHVIHPLAGQGVNLGLLDAAVLAEEVGYALRTGRDVSDDAALGRYQRRRRGENLLMQQAMRGFQGLFGRRELPVRLLRNTGLRWVNRLPPMRRFFVHQALGRGGDLPVLARGNKAPGHRPL